MIKVSSKLVFLQFLGYRPRKIKIAINFLQTRLPLRMKVLINEKRIYKGVIKGHWIVREKPVRHL